MNNRLRTNLIRWHRDNGGHGKCGLAPHALRMLREMVELCVAAGANRKDILQDVGWELEKVDEKNEWGGNPDAVGGEVADVNILLQVFCHYANILPDDQAEVKYLTLLKRKWITHPEGTLWRDKGEAA